ncbi:MAG: protein kinase [Nannocystaceae bacterium]
MDPNADLDETLPAGSPAADAPTPAPLEGHVLAGRYRLLGVLGEGGMGTVYRVHDLELDEVVALKTLRREWIDAPGALDRFRSEVKLARRVTHRGIARTFDIGDHDGERFLTMEWINGPSLSRRLAESGPPSIGEVVRVAAEIAEALVAAHAAGVIHRDLKPDNILLAVEGRVVITDFGIARRATPASGAPREGEASALIGTPAYMAPEQVQAAPGDARSDLYALGLVLYELLTGRRAFSGDSVLAVATARLVEDAPDPRALRPNTPAPLAALTLRLLRRSPEDRPASARVVADELQALAASDAAAATQSGPRPPIPPALPHRPRSLALFPLRSVGAAEDAWIGDGLRDDLIDSLSMVRGLRVKARVDPIAEESPQEYGRRLDVALVLEGSVLRRGEDIRLILRLSTVHDGFQVWARRFDCRFADLFISDRAADARSVGEVREAATRASLDPAALELYLRARDLQARRPIAWRKPLELLREALARAPEDPTLLSAYAYTLATSEFDVGPEATGRFEEARNSAARALEIAPHLADPWVALARVDYLACDTAAALRDLKRALRNGPSVARAHDLVVRILTELDRHDEARRHIDITLSIDSSLTYAMVDRIRIDALAGRWDEAIAGLSTLDGERREFALMIGVRLSLWQRRDVIEGPPTGRNWLVDTTYSLAREAIATGQLSDNFEHALANLLEHAPKVSRATRLFRQIEAEFSLVTGDRSRGLAAVEASVQAGLEDLAWIRRCPLLAPLRDAGALDEALATVEGRAAAALRAWDDA